MARVKKLSISKYRGEVNELTDLFLASASCEAIKKISVMVYLKMREEIVNNVQANVCAKKILIIAERSSLKPLDSTFTD